MGFFFSRNVVGGALFEAVWVVHGLLVPALPARNLRESGRRENVSVWIYRGKSFPGSRRAVCHPLALSLKLRSPWMRGRGSSPVPEPRPFDADEEG